MAVNAPEWCANIRSGDWRTPPGAVGSRMDSVAQFLGRRLVHTYEVAAPVMAAAVRRNTTKDLDRLEQVLESRA